MSKNFKDRLINSLRDASKFDSGNLVAPVAVLWPDPEKQWVAIIEMLQQEMPELLVLGNYEPEKKTGPAIWLKCMVDRTLPSADWIAELVPILYLPGISKNDLKELENADPPIAPLMEYQYTGVLWTHRNGKEWTVTAFLQNKEEGLGLNVSSDNATRDASQKALRTIFQDTEISFPSHVSSEFLYQLLFQNEVQSILEWMCHGDAFLNELDADKSQVFSSICQTKYDFVPVQKNIRAITENLAMQKGHWKKVWDFFALAPLHFPQVISELEKIRPPDIGGLFAVPEDSWPIINEEAEESLRISLAELEKLSPVLIPAKIYALESLHSKRRKWVWASLGRSNLAIALKHLVALCEGIEQPWEITSLDSLTKWYTIKGFLVDYSAIEALGACKSEKEKQAIIDVLKNVYSNWLQKLNLKFQELVKSQSGVFNDLPVKNLDDEFILFVDAFRYDIARKWAEEMEKKNFKTTVDSTWTILPSLTPSCKPFLSPIAERVSRQSDCLDFKPQTIDGKDLTFPQFESEIDYAGYDFPKAAAEISKGKKAWMEIGKIDKSGHEEQSGLVHRIPELFSLIEERVKDIFAAGYKRIRIVTDHGWLLVPGGMPRENLPKDHIETRWGRCAVLKEGVPSSFLHLPWFWNNSVMIAYAPGISFFKANNEYAHGGVSLQECLIPIISIETSGLDFIPISMDIKWIGLKCSVELKGVQPGCKIEIRTKHTDENTSITKTKEVSGDGKLSLFVENEDYESTAAFIVVTDKDGFVLEKMQTIIGE